MKKSHSLVIVSIIVFGLLIFAYVASAITIQTYSKEIEKKKNQIEVLLNENKQLRTNYEALIAKDRIVTIASSSLGMIFPSETPEILIIKKEKIKTLEEN